MTHDEMIEVIQAHKEGKAIDGRLIGSGDDDWRIDDEPTWDFSKWEYRVRPEPAVIYATIDSQGHVALSLQDQRSLRACRSVIRRFVEDMNWKP